MNVNIDQPRNAHNNSIQKVNKVKKGSIGSKKSMSTNKAKTLVRVPTQESLDDHDQISMMSTVN
jgi:hypothetical protein